MAYVLIVMTIFEGITNWRLNLIVSHILNKVFDRSIPAEPSANDFRVDFAAERGQRIFIGVMFYLIYFVAPAELWMFNWLFAFGMILSGVVMFCPVVALFRYLGFR